MVGFVFAWGRKGMEVDRHQGRTGPDARHSLSPLQGGEGKRAPFRREATKEVSNWDFAKWGRRVLDFGRLLAHGPHNPSNTANGELVRRRRGGPMGVVVTPSAREKFTPRELTAAYKVFKGRGP
jgi:hypothetical protein